MNGVICIKHLVEAVTFFEQNGFVTEKGVSSIMNSAFRRKLEEYFETVNLNYNCFAENYKDSGWLYYYYNPDIFPNLNERKEHARKYF